MLRIWTFPAYFHIVSIYNFRYTLNLIPSILVIIILNNSQFLIKFAKNVSSFFT